MGERRTVDLMDVFEMLLERMELDDIRTENKEWDEGRKFGIGQVAELLRDLKALPPANGNVPASNEGAPRHGS